VQPDAPLAFMVDATRLQQILLNASHTAHCREIAGMLHFRLFIFFSLRFALTFLLVPQLLSNAIKFTNTGQVSLGVTAQPVTVAPLSARISAEVAQGSGPAVAAISASAPRLYELVFSVRDNGIGISEFDMSKLFQSFSQAHMSAARYGGTGQPHGTIFTRAAAAQKGTWYLRDGVRTVFVFVFLFSMLTALPPLVCASRFRCAQASAS
jgi:hypothetical protein